MNRRSIMNHLSRRGLELNGLTYGEPLAHIARSNARSWLRSFRMLGFGLVACLVPSLASASEYQECADGTAVLWAEMSASVGGTDSDQAQAYVDGFRGCLIDRAGWRDTDAAREANALLCLVEAQIAGGHSHEAFQACEARRAEYLAERAP